MWARIVELLLGGWLLASPFLFSIPLFDDWLAALLVLLFAGLSFFESLNKMHLLQVVPAGWLIYLSFSYPTPYLPFYLQNDLLVALSLFLFAVIPSNASDHPRPWRNFLKRHSNK
jgi:hypothetical protein